MKTQKIAKYGIPFMAARLGSTDIKDRNREE